MAPTMSAPVTSAAHVTQDKGSEMSAAPSRFVPDTLEDVQRIARMFYFSGLMKKAFYKDASQAGVRDAVAGISTMILYGAELGLSPMQAMRAMHVIEGQATLSAAGKVALVKRSPRCLYFRVVEESDEHCTCETVRVEAGGLKSPPHRLTVKVWWKDAKDIPPAEKGVVYVLPSLDKQGVPTAVWARTPARMVKARCSSWLADDVYEDVTLGLYSAEEVVDFADRRSDERRVEDIFAMVDSSPAAPGRAEAPDVSEPDIQAPSAVEEPADGLDEAALFEAHVEDLRRRIERLGAGDGAPAKAIADELRAMAPSAERRALVRDLEAKRPIVEGTAGEERSDEGGGA